jgi:L-ascorbate metabolism protein UlaG (beta-lactamase superfamily)
MPDIDLMILSHNHYDHLDTGTITKLAPRTRAFVVPLGVGQTIACCGVRDQPVTELDWWETVSPMAGMELTATPARHFSGRGLVRGGSLWCSFVLKLGNDLSIFLGGDSGYEQHFRQIGEKYGPFDLAILECGQYNEGWPHIHMMPEQTAQAAVDLQTKLLLPVHWAKFTLANHAWNEPVQRLRKAAASMGLAVTTPMIGEPVPLRGPYPQSDWWNF